MVREFNVHIVNLDPYRWFRNEESKTLRSAIPSKMNSVLGTVVIAPLTTTLRKYPSRVEIRFGSKFCEVCIDQIRAVDEARLSKESLGRLKQDDIDKIKDTFAEVFEL